MTRRRLFFTVPVLLGMAAAPASAQVASASTPALGMGDNFTAAARGYDAVAWNPAGLGMAGTLHLSASILTMRGVAGIDPVTLGDLNDYEGKVVPAGVRDEWLARIAAEGGEQGVSGFDGNWAALQVGRFAVQFSSSARSLANLSPGVAELLMSGNADASGNPQDIELAGSTMDVAAYSTVAASFAQPVGIPGLARASVGVTAKYTIGHLLLLGAESTGAASADPLAVQLRFPLVHTSLEDRQAETGDPNDEDGFSGNNGTGIGFDIGVALETGMWTLGATVQNVFNTFEWDESALRYRANTLLFTDEERTSEFDSVPLDSAADVPEALRDAVAGSTFKPVFAVGAAARVLPALLLTADARMSSADGIPSAPRTHLGGGVEYRPFSWLPLRGGVSYVQLDDEHSGVQLSGGLGVDLGPFSLAASAARRSTGLGADTSVMFTVLSLRQ